MITDILQRKPNETTLSYYKRIKDAATDGLVEINDQQIYQILFNREASQDHSSKARRTIDLLLESDECNYMVDTENAVQGDVGVSQKATVDLHSDGSQSSSLIVRMNAEQSKDALYLLQVHGYDSSVWDVVSAKSSIWNMKSQENGIEDLYSSKITVKPKSIQWTFEDIDKYFKSKEFNKSAINYTPTNYDPNGEILEITLPDIHSGLMSWHSETGDKDYDVKIAKECFYKCLSDIIDRIKDKKFSKIYFVPLGDLLHADNLSNTTTKGTALDCDGRFGKYFDSALDMVIDGVEMLSNFSKIEVPYIAGNHDNLTGYTLMKAVYMAFRNNDNVIIDTSPNPRKFRREGKVLIGWVHGDMPKQNISEWLQIEARKEFGESEYTEVHAGHYHSQQVVEKSGMIVRYLPTICPSSTWEHSMGFPRTQRCVVSFVWNPNSGLREMWFSNL